ncbi:hypothetical protein D9C73_019593 [Collichthys lucidus]|uniref:Uncharacterized protein n=1 Tax=Collichthys lucidus TaxID=240159 RepID=A0A4U5VCW8_COLLU|nr:hypothetical protein D9C73_019593 [Collichthys lucidus]
MALVDKHKVKRQRLDRICEASAHAFMFELACRSAVVKKLDISTSFIAINLHFTLDLVPMEMLSETNNPTGIAYKAATVRFELACDLYSCMHVRSRPRLFAAALRVRMKRDINEAPRPLLHVRGRAERGQKAEWGIWNRASQVQKKKRSQSSVQLVLEPLSSAFSCHLEKTAEYCAPSLISFYSNYTTVIKQDISGDDGQARNIFHRLFDYIWMEMDTSSPYICFHALINRDHLRKGFGFSHSDMKWDLRTASWDTLGANEGQWDRAESVYEQQARVAGRRSSLSYGEGGGWYEPPPGVQPPDLDLKRDYSYQDSHYGQVYADRHDPRGMRKGSVPDLNHYERAPMAHRGSISHQDYYSHDPAITPRPPEGFYRPEHQPPSPHPHPLSRSGSHFGIAPGSRAVWDHGQGGRTGPQAPASPLPPPPPPPTAHELNRAYREPGAGAKMTPDGQQRIPSPVHYGMEHASPRYASEPPPMTGQSVYTDVNGRPLDPQQQAATCLVVDPASQAAPVQTAAVAPAAPVPVQATLTSVPPPPVTQLPAPLPPPPLMAPQTPLPVDHKKNVDPEFLALLRNEGLSESTISSVIQQGFDSTSMLAVMEENDVRTVTPNLGQARVLSRLVHNCKRPVDALPAHSQPPTPMRSRSNSFSHRSDIYLQQQHHHPPHPPQGLAVDPQMMPPQPPGAMHTISPRMDVIGRRPSSAPSQHLLEASGGYPGQPPRSPGPYAGAIMPVQQRPMSAYSSGMAMPGMPMQGMQMMPQQMTGSMPAIAGTIHSMQGYATADARVHASFAAATTTGTESILYQLHSAHGADEEGQELTANVTHAEPSPQSSNDARLSESEWLVVGPPSQTGVVVNMLICYNFKSQDQLDSRKDLEMPGDRKHTEESRHSQEYRRRILVYAQCNVAVLYCKRCAGKRRLERELLGGGLLEEVTCKLMSAENDVRIASKVCRSSVRFWVWLLGGAADKLLRPKKLPPLAGADPTEGGRTRGGNVATDSVRLENKAPKLINFDVTDNPRRAGDKRPLQSLSQQHISL